MEFSGDCLDELLTEVYGALRSGRENRGTRGNTREILGATLRLTKPRARLSRSEDRGKPFSAIGELLWYLSGSNCLQFIHDYVPAYAAEADEDGTVYGAYGPRLLSMRGNINQVQSVVNLLRERPDSRRAVIQLFNAEDIATHHKEIPCTTTLQFFLREGAMHMAVTMRSNDAYKGLPHDVFCFTMLQELIARALCASLGEYIHFVGSMHLYQDDVPKVERYLDEGRQRAVEMPPMPKGDQFPIISIIQQVESRLRLGEELIASSAVDSDYWADIIRLLQAYWESGKPDRVDHISAEFSHEAYRIYAQGRATMALRNIRETK